MAGGEPDDIEDLLRQVDALNAGGSVPATTPPKTPAARPGAQDDHDERGLREHLAERAVGGLLPAAVSGGAVFLLFSLLPLVSGLSGGLGAFLAVWVVWVLRGR